MNLRIKLTPMQLAAGAGALLAAGCGLVLHEYPLGRGLAQSSYDLLMVLRGEVRAPEAVIVYMDEDSHQKLGQPYNAVWDRALHARLIDRLTVAGARAIVFDVVFSDPNLEKAAADEALAKAIAKNRRVVLAADYAYAGGGANKITPPFDLVRDAAAGMGSDELLADADVVVRRHTLRGESPISSLSWVAAGLCDARLAKQENLEDVQRWMNYYGPAKFIPWKSY